MSAQSPIYYCVYKSVYIITQRFDHRLSHKFSRRIPDKLSYSYTENPWYILNIVMYLAKKITCINILGRGVAGAGNAVANISGIPLQSYRKSWRAKYQKDKN